MQRGTEQVAAGYVIYGSSCMMVYTTGKGVNGFTLDPSIGEFCLSHPNMQTPKQAKTYSINEGNYVHFPEGVKDYNFITDESKTRETGFLAQDLYKIYPSAVTVGGNDATQNPWGIDYGKITPLLVKAIQDQQVEIENQKTQLLNKEGEIKSLQERLEKLEKAVNKLFK